MNMRRFFTHCSFILGMGVCALSMTLSESQAADRKMFPGSDCKPYFMHIGEAKYYSNGAVANTDTDNLYLTCPIMRDNTGNTNGLRKVKIGYQDGHPSQNVKCYVTSRDHNGAYLNSVSGQSPVWQGTQSPTKGLFTFSGPKQSKKVISHYFATCILPAKTNVGESRIFAIDVEEY